MLICLKYILIFMTGSLSTIYEFFIDGMCVVALTLATDIDHEWGYIPSSCYDFVDEWHSMHHQLSYTNIGWWLWVSMFSHSLCP